MDSNTSPELTLDPALWQWANHHRFGRRQPHEAVARIHGRRKLWLRFSDYDYYNVSLIHLTQMMLIKPSVTAKGNQPRRRHCRHQRHSGTGRHDIGRLFLGRPSLSRRRHRSGTHGIPKRNPRHGALGGTTQRRGAMGETSSFATPPGTATAWPFSSLPRGNVEGLSSTAWRMQLMNTMNKQHFIRMASSS